MNNQSKYFHRAEHRKFQNSSRATLWSLLITTLIFTIVEFVGGLYVSSLTLLSDSFHMLSDALALGLSMPAIYSANKPSTEHYTYGLLRLEVIVASLNGLALIVISLGIMYEGILRIIHPKPVASDIMIFAAVLGLIINIILVLILFRSLKKEDNVNTQSTLWYFFEDLLNSIGVIVAVVPIHFTGWATIDLIISITISLIILNGGYKIIKNAWKVLMEHIPDGYDSDEIINTMRSVESIINVHEFHLWSITTNRSSLSAHVVLSDEYTKWPYSTVNKVSKLLEEKYNLEHVTLQIENIHLNHLDEDYFKQYEE